MTFIDLPIHRKFTLFSLGVIFWLLALAALAVVTLLRVDDAYSHILRETIPHDLAAQKIASQLETINRETTDLCQATSAPEVLLHAELILSRLEEIQEIAVVLDGGRETLAGKKSLAPNSESMLEHYPGPEVHDLPSLRDFTAAIEEFGRGVRKVTAERIAELQPGNEGRKVDAYGAEFLKSLLRKAEILSFGYAGEMTSAYRQSTVEIAVMIRNSFLMMAAVLGLALILLGIFTRWIAVAIARPIRAITGQIHSLSSGDVDLSEKIAITSKDEIGILAAEFNGLMESVYGMTAFKNVIEEDSNLQDIYARLGAVFAEVAQMTDYCIYEIKDNQQEMIAVYPLGRNVEQLRCLGEILGNCELCRARKTGHAISSLVYAGICQSFKADGDTQQHICVPINVGGHIGVVVQFLFTPDGGVPLDRLTIQHQVDRATVYLKEAQSVLEAKRLLAALRESALKDALTGLYNRRFLQEHSSKIAAGCHRRGTNIGLLMCDLDYFKQVNDQYGHETGDLLLRETATALLKSVREADYVIRFGGEEFLVLLVDVEEGEAVAVAEKIRRAVAAVRIQTVTGPVSKTISIGVSLFPADGEAFWQTIKFADVALYKAKEIGRDRVVRFAPEMWSGDSF